jgi:MFS family permease
MEKAQRLRTRLYSFAIAAGMDGMLGFVILATPLFAIKLGATAWQLGMLGWVSQLVRVPFTLFSGRISDKIGRMRVIYPSAILGAVGCVGLVFSHSYAAVLVWYTAVMVAMGGFYPALMAFIGDRSPQGQLRKNLSFFNAGWASSCTVCGLAVGVLLPLGVWTPFGAGAVLVSLGMLLVFIWSRLPYRSSPDASTEPDPQDAPASPGPLLLIARIGLFLTVFGFAVITSLFPKLGKELAMSDSKISVIVGMLLVGQAAGIFTAGASPWWRGKLWPHLLAQSATLLAGIVILSTSSSVVFGTAFLVIGTAVGITYSAALYYSLQSRSEMGKNTGIHEAMIAVASIAGNLAGGATAQMFTLRTPYLVMAGLSGVTIVVSVGFWMMKKNASRQTSR